MRKLADKKLDRVNLAKRAPDAAMTFDDFVRVRFEPQVMLVQLKPAGIKHYRYHFEKHVLPALGKMRICDIGPDDVQCLITEKSRAGFSPQTLKHIRNVVSATFRHAENMRIYLERNPTRGVVLPTITPVKRPTYTTEQVGAILVRLKSHEVYEMALLSLAASTGPAEMCGLRLKHLNLTRHVLETGDEILAPYSIAIRENYYLGQWGSLKTGNRSRNLPLDPPLAKLLAALILRSKRQDPEAPLFQSRTGRPMDTHNVANRNFPSRSASSLAFRLSGTDFGGRACRASRESQGKPPGPQACHGACG